LHLFRSDYLSREVSTMTTLPLPSQTLAWLIHAADAGQCDAQALLHLLARADKRDQDVAKFVDSYSSTIAALCRRLDAMERGANLRQQDEDAEATEADSVADTAQRITDYAAKAGLTVQDWAKAFNAAPVDASPVANALLQAEAALADVAEGEIGRLCSATKKAIWTAEARCTEALAAIRPAMRQHGIRTSEFPTAVPAPAPTPSAALQRLIEAPIDARGYVDLSERKPAPTPRPTALVEVVGNELPLLPDGRVDEARTRALIYTVAAWLDTRGQYGCSVLLREEIIDQ
jgi:hypothetical protein